MSYELITTASFVVGQSQTSAIRLNENTLVGVTITGSKISATTMTFLVSTDGTNFYPLYDNDSTEVSLTTTTAARSYNTNPKIFFPWNFVKARLGTSASAVLQATANQNVEFNMKKL